MAAGSYASQEATTFIRRTWSALKSERHRPIPLELDRADFLRSTGIVEAFNVLNTENLTTFNGVFGSLTYLQPALAALVDA
jgi:hypothetical protein